MFLTCDWLGTGRPPSDPKPKHRSHCLGAAFVCSSALGTALGPLLSTVFKRFPSLHVGPLTLDATTMGGWAMAVAWVVFIAAWLALFQEPPACALCHI
jgi:hypothetical protein